MSRKIFEISKKFFSTGFYTIESKKRKSDLYDVKKIRFAQVQNSAPGTMYKADRIADGETLQGERKRGENASSAERLRTGSEPDGGQLRKLVEVVDGIRCGALERIRGAATAAPMRTRSGRAAADDLRVWSPGLCNIREGRAGTSADVMKSGAARQLVPCCRRSADGCKGCKWSQASQLRASRLIPTASAVSGGLVVSTPQPQNGFFVGNVRRAPLSTKQIFRKK